MSINFDFKNLNILTGALHKKGIKVNVGIVPNTLNITVNGIDYTIMTNNNDFIVYPTSLTPNDNGINHLKDICNYLEIPILRFVDEKKMLKKI